MHIPVDSHTDESGAVMPRGFRFDGSYVAVVETVDQWHGPDYRYVKVRAEDGGLYILRYDKLREIWALTMFESARAQELSRQQLSRQELLRQEPSRSGARTVKVQLLC
jgi:hypothetical protein